MTKRKTLAMLAALLGRLGLPAVGAKAAHAKPDAIDGEVDLRPCASNFDMGRRDFVLQLRRSHRDIREQYLA